MILSQDDAFHGRLARLLRSGPVSISVVNEGPGSRKADLFIVDARHDPAAGDGTRRIAEGRSGQPAYSWCARSRTPI
jgi:hypothetical protein